MLRFIRPLRSLTPLTPLTPIKAAKPELCAFPEFSYKSFLTARLAHSRAAKNIAAKNESIDKLSQNSAQPATPPETRGGPKEQNKILAKTPKFLHRYVERYFRQVISAPASHITAFLILHELTAIVPLAGLWWTFHHFGFVPTGLPDWIMAKGVGFAQTLADKYQWEFASKAATSSKFLMEGAAAYGIVKLTLPVRAVFSVMLMPWFARIFVLPVTGLFKRKKSVGPSAKSSEIAPVTDKSPKEKESEKDKAK